MDATVDAARQVPQHPRVHRPEGQLRAGGHATVPQQPLELGRREVRVEHQAGGGPHQVEVAGLAQLVAPGGRAPVLPDEGPVQGPTGPPVPHDRRLALVGDADRGDGLAVEMVDQFGERVLGGRPDVGGIVLDQPGRREVLGELAVGVTGGRAVGPHREAAHAGRSGVDGDDHGHRPDVRGASGGRARRGGPSAICWSVCARPASPAVYSGERRSRSPDPCLDRVAPCEWRC